MKKEVVLELLRLRDLVGELLNQLEPDLERFAGNGAVGILIRMTHELLDRLSGYEAVERARLEKKNSVSPEVKP